LETATTVLTGDSAARHRNRAWYPANVSDKPPQNYMIHTAVLFAVLVAAMVWFLFRQWG
jgi:hypothetical protein